MTVWMIVGLVVGLALVALLLFGRSRPKTAEEVLGQRRSAPISGPRGSGASGTALKSELQALMSRRATGVLTVSSGGETCSIYMLFGHLFHAECGSVEGEGALRMALKWANPTSSFDATGKLPTKETITRIIDSMSL